MRRTTIITFIITCLLMLAFALPASANISNANLTVTCTGLTITGTAQIAGSIFVDATRTADGFSLVSAAVIPVNGGANFSATYNFPEQTQGTSIDFFMVLNGFTVNQTVACAGPFPAGGIGDGRLNGGEVGAPIAVFCEGGGVNIYTVINGQGRAGVRAGSGDIIAGLSYANQLQRNVQIAAGSNGVSLWALSSLQLQAVFRGSGANYDFVFSPSRCNIPSPSPLNTQPTAPPGVTLGEAAVLVGGGTPVPVYGTTTTGTTPVYTTAANTGSCVAPAGARAAVVVQPGQNLFRIGLAYGVDFNTLAAYNGITDPARIYVGQCIIIP